MYGSLNYMLKRHGAMTISSGTLRARHLAPDFMDELKEWDRDAAEQIELRYPEIFRAEDVNERLDREDEEVGYLMEELFDALDRCAPDGFWFGASEDDPACFGFWPVEAEQE